MTVEKVEHQEDWLDRFAARLSMWLNSLTEKNETQNLGEWSHTIQEERQGQEKTSGT